MDSGLLHLAMPGSLYPAFTHSDNQCRLQSQWRGLVPRALEGRRGSQALPGLAPQTVAPSKLKVLKLNQRSLVCRLEDTTTKQNQSFLSLFPIQQMLHLHLDGTPRWRLGSHFSGKFCPLLYSNPGSNFGPWPPSHVALKHRVCQKMCPSKKVLRPGFTKQFQSSEIEGTEERATVEPKCLQRAWKENTMTQLKKILFFSMSIFDLQNAYMSLLQPVHTT